MNIVYPAPTMSKARYAEYTGFSVGRLEGWIKRRQWRKGVQYAVEGRTTIIDREEADKWLLGRVGRQVSGQVEEESELPSTAREVFAMTKPYQATHTVVLT